MFGEHSVVEDSYNKNSIGELAIKDDVTSLLNATQTRTYFVCETSYGWHICNLSAAGFKLGEIAIGLINAPTVDSEGTDLQEVFFGAAR